MSSRRTQIRAFESMLREWYGKGDAPSEIMPHLPQTQSLQTLIQQITKHRVHQGCMKLIELQNDWESIAGQANAKHTRPVFLADGVLHVEVAHPAYRMAMNSPLIIGTILKRIQEKIGPESCHELRFVPAGRGSR